MTHLDTQVQWCIRTFKGAQDSSVSQGVVEDSPLKRDCYIPYGHQQYALLVFAYLYRVHEFSEALVRISTSLDHPID